MYQTTTDNYVKNLCRTLYTDSLNLIMRYKMKTNEFKYDSLLSDLKKENRKFNKILDNPHPTWSKDDTRIYNKFLDLFEEVKWQSLSSSQ